MSALGPAECASLAPMELDARFRRRLMSYFLSRVGDHAEAEDLTQQTFLRLLATSRGGIVNPAAFVFQVAANLLKDRTRDRIRHKRGQTCSLDDAAEGSPALADVLTPERIVVGRESVARILRALEDLSPNTRDVFLLFRFGNLRQRDIAARCGLSLGAVEKHIMRATVHLMRQHTGD